MPVIRIVLLLVLTAALAPQAHALSYEDLAGKWCGEISNYVFARKQLTVTFDSGAPTRRFKVESYEVLDDRIKMHWIDGSGERVFTDFAEFSRDRRFMAQQANKAGPRRPFRRCK